MLKKMTGGRLFCLLMTLVMLAMAAVVYYNDTLSHVETQTLIQSHKQGVGQLTEEKVVMQHFTVAGDGFCGVEVMASNYNKKVKTGTLTLWLTDEQGKELARQEYPVADMKNNAFLKMEMPAVAGSAGKTYALHASSDCTEQKGVTLRMGPADTVVGKLTLADGTVTTENAMNLRIRCEEKQYSTMGGGLMLLIALCFAACIPLAGGKERRHG